MSKEKEKWIDLEAGGYQAKTDKPLRKPPVGGSNVTPPPQAKEDKK